MCCLPRKSIEFESLLQEKLNAGRAGCWSMIVVAIWSFHSIRAFHPLATVTVRHARGTGRFLMLVQWLLRSKFRTTPRKVATKRTRLQARAAAALTDRNPFHPNQVVTTIGVEPRRHRKHLSVLITLNSLRVSVFSAASTVTPTNGSANQLCWPYNRVEACVYHALNQWARENSPAVRRQGWRAAAMKFHSCRLARFDRWLGRETKPF
jgi:hypothetical protein